MFEVVETRDAIGYIKLGFRTVRILALLHIFPFSGSRKALGYRVVPALAFAVHVRKRGRLRQARRDTS